LLARSNAARGAAHSLPSRESSHRSGRPPGAGWNSWSACGASRRGERNHSQWLDPTVALVTQQTTARRHRARHGRHAVADLTVPRRSPESTRCGRGSQDGRGGDGGRCLVTSATSVKPLAVIPFAASVDAPHADQLFHPAPGGPARAVAGLPGRQAVAAPLAALLLASQRVLPHRVNYRTE